AEHATLGRHRLVAEPTPDGPPALLFTENETNTERLFAQPNASAHVKDAFHEYLVHGRTEAVNPAGIGTKAAAHYRLTIAAGAHAVVQLRLTAESVKRGRPFGSGFDALVSQRREEADAFYSA